ncbi:hypothetical protein ACOME3_006575 [Neoechinorhynchus agilis]
MCAKLSKTLFQYRTGKVISAIDTGTSNPKKTKFPVEDDPHKLLMYCCGTDFLKNSNPVKLKDDSEYPEWLWSLNCSGGPTGDELNEQKIDYFLYQKQLTVKQRGLVKANQFPELPRDPIYDNMKPI